MSLKTIPDNLIVDLKKSWICLNNFKKDVEHSTLSLDQIVKSVKRKKFLDLKRCIRELHFYFDDLLANDSSGFMAMLRSKKNSQPWIISPKFEDSLGSLAKKKKPIDGKSINLEEVNQEFDIQFGDIKINLSNLLIEINENRFFPHNSSEMNAIGALICMIEKINRKEKFEHRAGLGAAIYEAVVEFKKLKRKPLTTKRKEKFANESISTARKLLEKSGSKYQIEKRSMTLSLR